jgi:hypothetical protein
METVQAYEVEAPPITSEEGAFEAYAKLTDQKRELKDQLAAIERQIAPLEEYLLTVFESHPGKGAHKTGGYSIYTAHETWARSGPDRKRTVDALLALGYGFDTAVSINASFLSGVVREYKAEGKELPSGLKEAIVVDEKVVVRARKA